MSASWKITLPCTLEEARAIALGDEAEAGVALITTEENEEAGQWRLDAYFEGKPGLSAIRAVKAMVPSAASLSARPTRLPDADWITLSQAGLEPVRAGRFFVHTSAYQGGTPAGMRAYQIEASRAFGTGHHETTSGCLMMLDKMRQHGARVDNLIDLGTGTGLLAFAALQLWPRAYATATDIDPVSIDVTTENAAINAVPTGQRQGHIALDIASGTDSALVQRRAPYDLIIANILAGPLIELASDIAAIAAPQAQVVLAGLLTRQAEMVARAYRRTGFRVAERLVIGDWTILRLRLRRRSR